MGLHLKQAILPLSDLTLDWLS